jgi:hypothetical protein
MTDDYFPAYLRRHLLDAANERPAEGQLASIVDRVAITPQRPSLAAFRWVPGRASPFASAAVRLGVVAGLLLAALVALALLAGGARNPSPVNDLLRDFLEARLAGAGVQQYLSVPEEEVPLLYATSSGARFDRAEFEQVRGVDWPRVWVAGLGRLADRTAFKVRLGAGDAVVEQLFFYTSELQPIGLGYLPDGFGARIPPTTENGQPVARLFKTLDNDEVTLEVAHPWVGWRYGTAPYGYEQTAIRLIPEGVGPTIDAGQRDDWDHVTLTPDPGWVGTDCRKSPDAADAAALAESIRSDPGLEATAPVVVSVGGVAAVMIDVKIAAGARLCVPATDGGYLDFDVGLLHSVFDVDARPVFDQGARALTGVAAGKRMRIYLFDRPRGGSMRMLAVAIIASESTFERTVGLAAPVVESIEFHAP